MRQKIYNLTLKSLSIALLALFAVACSSLDRYDDAVRIKAEKADKYLNIPNSDKMRDGRTLSGTVLKVLVEAQPISCEIDSGYGYTNSLIFINKDMPDQTLYYEKIPLEDVELVSSLYNPPQNEYGNINVFENFNNPDQMRGLRSVPVDTVVVDTCCPCRCQKFSLSGNFDLAVEMNCPQRDLSWYFVELRGVYSSYTDYVSLTKEEGRSSYSAEAAAGIRFGGFGIGLLYSSGIKVYDAFNGSDYLRPFGALHLRYSADKDKFLGLCMRPFIYGDFGISIDKLSLELPKLDWSTKCENCKQYLDDLKASGQLPQVDFSWPWVYGIGFGIDIPVASFIDLSADIGFRSVGVGEKTEAAGFENVPTMRRINMLLFRFGVTF